jgi:hypothetical protein
VIKNRLLTAVLYGGARLSRKKVFIVPNEISRQIYLHLITPVMELYLRASTPLRIRLLPRHSVLSSRHFSVFESDIDYSLIFYGSASQAELLRLQKKFRVLQKILPFVGELEIYADWEQRLKSSVLPEHTKLLELIHLLRKWTWQLSSMEMAPTKYHREKARRSIDSIRRRLGLEVGAVEPASEDILSLQTQINAILQPVTVAATGIHSVSHFLGWTITTSERERETPFLLTLRAETAIAFLSILPNMSEHQETWRELLRIEREKPAIKALFLAVCVQEFILIQSVRRRGEEAKAASLAKWSECLLENIRLLGPADLVEQINTHYSAHYVSF